MFVDTTWRLCLLTLLIHSVATANVTVTTTPTLGAGIILCDNENITLTCHTDQSGANFTWQWSNQSVQADTITVLVKLTKILYTCVVSDSNGQNIGKASITILANGSAPYVVSDNFHHYVSETEGHNLTLTTSVTRDLPLSSGYPVWRVLGDRSLPSTAVVDNYTEGGILHSRLSLYNLSYFDDSGNYTNTASNKCGTSFIFVFIQVTKAPIMCDHPANVTKPLHGPVVTVEGEYLSLSCSFRGNLEFLIPSLTSYWKIDFNLPHNEKMYIFDNSSDLYHIALYQTCLTSDGSCCNFISQLIIFNASLSLSYASLTCTEGLSVVGKDEPVEHSSSTTIVVLNVPRIIDGPIELQGHRPRMLQCQFNASTLQGVTVVVWKKNNIELHNSSDYIITQNSNPELEDPVISTLTINSSDYYGIYSCYCYYNSSLVKSAKPIISNEASITLKRSKPHGLSRIDKIAIGAGSSVVLMAISILSLLLFFFIMRKRPGSSSELKPLIQADDENIQVVAAEEDTSPGYGSFPGTKQSPVFKDGINGGPSSLRTGEKNIYRQRDMLSGVDQMTQPHQSLNADSTGAPDSSPVQEWDN